MFNTSIGWYEASCLQTSTLTLPGEQSVLIVLTTCILWQKTSSSTTAEAKM
jgi:hypothetical protein